MRYAQVALNVPVRKAFSYHIPKELSGRLKPGSLVRVEFGVAMQPGLILALQAETDIPETKPIIELLSILSRRSRRRISNWRNGSARLASPRSAPAFG